MGITWRNGDMNTLVAGFKLLESDIQEGAHEAMTLSTNAGWNEMEHVIETAVTDTGRERAKNGGASGRIDTGDMHSDVKSSSTIESHGVYVGKIGWPDAQAYYALQDDGTTKIPPMHALLQGFVVARDKLISELVQIARTGKAKQ